MKMTGLTVIKVSSFYHFLSVKKRCAHTPKLFCIKKKTRYFDHSIP